MEESILKSTKKALGLTDSVTAYDPEIIMYINTILSVLHDIGIGPDDGLFIEDDGTEWEELEEPPAQVSMVKSWLALRVRMLFDPPTTSYQITAMQEQIEQFEVRLSYNRDHIDDPAYPTEEVIV